MTGGKKQAILKLWPRQLSIQLQMLFCLLIGSSITIATYSNVQSEIERLSSSIQAQARILAENISSTSGELLLTRDYTSLELLLFRSIRFNDIKRIQVTDKSGKLLSTVLRSEDLEPLAQYGQPPINVPDKLSASVVIKQETDELVAWQPIFLGEHIGWVKITYSLLQLKTVTSQKWTEGIIDGLIYIGLVIGFIIIVLRKPLATIQCYTQFADRIHEYQGDLVEVDCSAVELEKLGKALNNASSTVYKNTSDLQQVLNDMERIAAFTEYSPDIILSIKQGGFIQYMNPQAVRTVRELGLKQEEIFLLLPENIMELLTSSITEQTSAREIEVKYKNRSFLWTFAPVIGQELLNCYAMDITQLKMAEQDARQAMVAKLAAEQASHAKSQFLANMSHELRTPLNAIIGYSEIIEDEVMDAGYDKITPDLLKIRSAGRHLLSLINEILDLSKIEAGKMDIYIEPVDVKQLVTDIVNTVDTLVKTKNNRLIVNLHRQLNVINTDIIKLRQVLLNLISNASKFTENGTITLTVDQYYVQNQNWISFVIEDTGIGMTEEEKVRVFNAFAQADSSTTRRFGGTGLGLAISQTFCHMLGGSISVKSKPGEGSTFYVNLPAQSSQQKLKASNE